MWRACKFNALGYRTISLNGDVSEAERAAAFERLAMDEKDSKENKQPLDYIFSVKILNEGWEFPGGKNEEWETSQEALLRETKEELDSVEWLPADITLIDKLRESK